MTKNEQVSTSSPVSLDLFHFNELIGFLVCLIHFVRKMFTTMYTVRILLLFRRDYHSLLRLKYCFLKLKLYVTYERVKINVIYCHMIQTEK